MNTNIAMITSSLIGLATLITSCSPQFENAELVTKEVPVQQPAANSAIKKEPAVGPGLQRLVELAKQDLSEQLAISEDKITFVEGKFVTWRDMSLGCPKPGMGYGQALVNGSLIKFAIDAKVYQYHSGANRRPFLCRNPAKNEPLPYKYGET